MRKLFATLLTLAAVTPLFWHTISPKILNVCNSSVGFAYHPLTDHGKMIAGKAKVQACNHAKKFAR